MAEDQEQQQEEDVDMAEEVPLARTTSGLEQQLQAALEPWLGGVSESSYFFPSHTPFLNIARR